MTLHELEGPAHSRKWCSLATL